ncbi:MAG: hypothetical protein QNJ45_08135 [Ardenticatenaceae bacterium]|nr:hypothetical protein [Ardenticatenaceae bacterium]
MTVLKSTGQTENISANRALWAGIIFSFLFSLLIWVIRPWLPQIDFLPDQGASWYYWQLPEQTVMGQITAWSFYFAHQAFTWGTIYVAQRQGLKYTKGVHRINVIALLGTAFFISLHLLQTAVWYDGLAQDTSIWSSQWSVIIMLVFILHMENQRRGIFWGKKIGFLTETGRFLRKYHGYIFAWGIVYTFWYHPMENTLGHVVGFFYMFLLMTQGTLMFTRAHVNKYWTFVLEIMVLFHGTTVAIEQIFTQGYDIWPMFLFGFAGIFIITQMHGLGLKNWQKWGFLGLYIVGVLVMYSDRGWVRLEEVARIPIIEYASVFVGAILIWIGMKITSYFRPKGDTGKVASAD